jgi:hypothetical protein
LKLQEAPLSYYIAHKDTPRKRLLYYDEETNANHPLRYARNSRSPFQDDQDANVIVEPIVFEDGFLTVARTNPVLQSFLYYHPMNGIVFEEVDKEKEAKDEVEDLNMEVDALIQARNLTIEQLEMMTRVLFGKDPTTITTAELKRDVLVFAKSYPADFLQAFNDPELKYQAKIRSFFEDKLLAVRNNGREIWFTTPTNKKKMCSVPHNNDPYDFAGHFLQSDEGLDSLKMLETFSES